MTHPSDSEPFLPAIVPGTMTLHQWGLSGRKLADWISACLDMGVDAFDLADLYGNYGNEELFGTALKADPSLQSRIRLVTKCGVMLLSDNRPDNRVKHYNTDPGHIVGSVENSLSLLNREAMDLLLVHRPDLLMDYAELGGVLDSLIDQGKVLRVGVSNFTPSQFSALQRRMTHPLATNQIRFNVLHTEPLFDGTIDQASELGWRPMAYAPFESGRLMRPDDETAIRLRAAFSRMQADYPFGENGVPVSWIHTHPVKPHIVVATRHLHKIAEMVEASKTPLDRQHWYELLEISRGFPVP